MEKKKGFFTKALDVIERVGNKLPDPFVLFIGLAFFMILLSFVFSLFGATVATRVQGKSSRSATCCPVKGCSSY